MRPEPVPSNTAQMAAVQKNTSRKARPDCTGAIAGRCVGRSEEGSRAGRAGASQAGRQGEEGAEASKSRGRGRAAEKAPAPKSSKS